MLLHPLPPPPLLSLCSFSLPSSFAAALLLTSSLFLLHHSPLSCRLGLAPAAVVLLSLLECTPNRAWIWKAPHHHHLTTLSSSSSFTLTLTPLPSYFLPPSNQLSLPALVSSLFLFLLLSTLFAFSCFIPLSLSLPFFLSLSLTLNVSPTLNSTHSGWATQCSVWMSGAILPACVNATENDKYRQFCMETGQRLCLTPCADIMLLCHTTFQYTQRQPCFVGIALMSSRVNE